MTSLFKTKDDLITAKNDFRVFSYDEISCHCCRRFFFDKKVDEFLDKIMAFRYSEVKTPLGCTNLFRCKSHNKEVGGAAASPHLYSLGIDVYPIYPKDVSLTAVFAKAISSGLFNGVGIYDSGIVHLDIKARPEKFLYWVDIKGAKKYFTDPQRAMEFWLKSTVGLRHE